MAKPPADPKSKAQALAASVEALTAAPADPGALVRVVSAIEAMGNKSLLAKGWEALAASAREDGQFALAVYAAAQLDELGDRKGSAAACAELAKAFASGSKRVDAARRPRPPAPPKTRSTPPPVPAVKEKGDKGGASAHDPQAAMKAAGEAIGKAAAAAAERAKQGEKLPAVPLVAALDEASLAKLVDLMSPLKKKAGDVVVDEGQDARSLYLVARGQLDVSRAGVPLSRLTAGAFFGEIALLSGARRTARVACEDEVWLLEVPRDALEAAAAKAPALADVLARHARARLLANTMRTSEIFKRLSVTERDHLTPRFVSHVLAPGAKILRKGEEATALHVVVSGAAEVKLDGRVLATLGPGDVFGEMSLVGRRPASADVVAKARTVTLALDRAGFDDVAVKHPELLAEVFKLLVEREQKNRTAESHVEIDAEDLVV